MTTSTIMWHKWRNPVRIPMAEDELSPAEIETRDNFQEASGHRHVERFIGAISAGPFGVVPVWSGIQCDDLFNFWEGHTCRAILTNDKAQIQRVPGVEEFTQLTPYRFRIAIARHPSFKPEKVRQSVEDVFVNVK